MTSRQSTNPNPASSPHPRRSMARGVFTRFAHEVAVVAGKPAAFLVALAIVIAWALTGPLFGYSDTWQLVINTSTTIVTFLMVFLIQNTQNRDTLALQLKLSELILVTKGAPDRLATLEEFSDEELERLHQEFREHADKMLVVIEGRRRGSHGRRSPKKPT
jgi:low affinity Fe/Cu permease